MAWAKRLMQLKRPVKQLIWATVIYYTSNAQELVAVSSGLLADLL
jgi:hypothetical protein